MHNKSEVRANVVNFISYIENHFQTKTKTIHTNNVVGFILKDFFASKDIIHQITCVETPEQNNIVERKHQHLLNVTTTIIFHSNLPANFLEFCCPTCYFLNKLYSYTFT